MLASDLIQETRAHIFTGVEMESNRLNGAINSSATALALKYDKGSITSGAVISIGLEEMRVWEVSGTTSLPVIERGVNGTTAVAHNDLDFVSVRPQFSDFRILRALNQELDDLGSPANGLFQVKTLDVTYNAAIQGYDMVGAGSITNLLELRWKMSGPSKNWPRISSYGLGREFATTEFSSGLPLFLYEAAYPGLPIRVRYSSDFTHVALLTDDVASTGLPATANDIPPMGAAIRLVAPREIRRNFTDFQDNPRRAEEVPAGAVGQSINDLVALRHSRIESEAARLASDWPLFLR